MYQAVEKKNVKSQLAMRNNKLPYVCLHGRINE